MLINLEAEQGEWFQFFGSHVEAKTGETIYHEPEPNARVQIRSMAPFIEDRLSKRKKQVEHVINPKTRALERLSYYADLTVEESIKERDDTWDYIITDFEGFKDSRTGEVIECTRENKIKLVKVPVFDRFIARCLEMLNNSGIKEAKELEKNS